MLIRMLHLMNFVVVGEWRIVGRMPLGMSDHCMVLLNSTHAILNAGEWLMEGDAMTGDSYVFDSTSMTFTKGILHDCLLSLRIYIPLQNVIGS